jgi:sugar-specific transcriptional regulator TrmB
MDIEALEKIGLTQSEIKVYISMLKLGIAKSGEILKESKMNSGRIYEIFESLKKKGLIGESIINNIRHFSASAPENLVEYVDKKRKILDEKEKLIKQIIPQLNNLSKSQAAGTKSLVYTGLNGMKIMAEDLLRKLEKGDTIYTLSVTGNKNEGINNFWSEFNLRSGSKGIKNKFLFQEGSSEFYKLLKKREGNEIRLTTLSANIPIAVYGKDNVVISNYDDPLTVILIINKEIADSFIEVFNQFWKKAKP